MTGAENRATCIHSFGKYARIDKRAFHGLELSFAVLEQISVSTCVATTKTSGAYRDEISNVTLSMLSAVNLTMGLKRGYPQDQ